MMDWTDLHCRFFHRLMTRRARLYTEMVTADAVVFGPRERLIGFDPFEHRSRYSSAGGARRLAEAARIGADFGYDEINLNCGCPSDRVQSGRFGACLMREPALVAECIAAMASAVRIPVTVKCRIGVDEQEPREALFAFVDAVEPRRCGGDRPRAQSLAGGAEPKDNRSIPPLDYPLVYDLSVRIRVSRSQSTAASSIWKRRANSWPSSTASCSARGLSEPGNAARRRPAIFRRAGAARRRLEAIEAFAPYVARELAKGTRLHDMTRHLLGLFAGRPGARLYRQKLATLATRPGAGLEVLREAVRAVARATLPEPA